ncbi:MAG: hypothetical protein MRJ65_14885 [Candidatus Brocadiaceae bacterium]|nr:hypothetical protein [Candidatus Brocadiaceae bacterium]
MFKIVTNLDDLVKAFIVRGIVFVKEQGIPYNVEHDLYEYSSIYILGEDGGIPFAAGRIRVHGEYAKPVQHLSGKKQGDKQNEKTLDGP